jgi:hypothetical protein
MLWSRSSLVGRLGLGVLSLVDPFFREEIIDLDVQDKIIPGIFFSLVFLESSDPFVTF